MADKEIISKYFDSHASTWHLKLNEYGFLDRYNTVKRIVKHIGNEKNVLDMGCGCGDYATLFLPSRYVGIDLSFCMIKQAQSRYPKYRFYQMDAESTRFADDSYGLILSIAVLEYLSDPHEHIKEIYRLLIPGGHTVIAVPHAGDTSKKRDAFIIKLLGRRAKPSLKKDPSIRHKAYHVDELRELCVVRHGFFCVITALCNHVIVPKFIDNRIHVNGLLSKIWEPRNLARCLIIVLMKPLAENK